MKGETIPIDYEAASCGVRRVNGSEQVRGERREVGASQWGEARRETDEMAERQVVGDGLKMAQSNKGMHPTPL